MKFDASHSGSPARAISCMRVTTSRGMRSISIRATIAQGRRACPQRPDAIGIARRVEAVRIGENPLVPIGGAITAPRAGRREPAALRFPHPPWPGAACRSLGNSSAGTHYAPKQATGPGPPAALAGSRDDRAAPKARCPKGCVWYRPRRRSTEGKKEGNPHHRGAYHRSPRRGAGWQDHPWAAPASPQ